jgi:hypothetical protein
LLRIGAVSFFLVIALCCAGCGTLSTEHFEPASRQSSLLLIGPAAPRANEVAAPVLLTVPANPNASKWYEDADRGKWFLDASKWFCDQD